MKTPTPPRRTFVDRFVEYVNPVRGLERMRARHHMAIVGQWYGAKYDRRATATWITTNGSADADTLHDLPRLRDRSRDLIRNNSLALGAVNTVVSNAMGTGLMLHSCVKADVLGLSDEEAQVLQRTIESEFRLWAENPIACDAAATLDFYQQQALVTRSALEGGDAFAVLPMKTRKASVYSLKVQLIEGDRVRNKDNEADTDTLAGGIERDELGAPIAYHITREHPGAIVPIRSLTWDIIPAFGTKTGRRNVIHLFDPKRIGQSRGVPYLSPVMEAIKQLGDYTEAEITAAVVSGMFTVFVKTENGQGLDLDAAGNPVEAPAKSGDNVKLASGAIVDLGANESIETANPGRPNANFDPFVQAILRQVGVALEIPFEILIGHFTASYSAARAALLQAWRFFRNRRAWVASMFCQPIFEAWFEEAVARGRIDAPGFFDDPVIRAAYLGSEWIGDAPGQIDPLKEIQAAALRMDAKLTSRTEEKAALDGGDWESTLARIKREKELMDEAGLSDAPVSARPDMTGKDPNADPNADPNGGDQVPPDGGTETGDGEGQ
jgi:lambda family phage portal protein